MSNKLYRCKNPNKIILHLTLLLHPTTTAPTNLPLKIITRADSFGVP